jgi:transmembrane sensor
MFSDGQQLLTNNNVMKKIDSTEEAIELIIDEFDNNLSGKEEDELQKWIASDIKNERLYREFHKVRDSVDILAVYKELDPDASWEALDQKLDSDSQFSTSHRKKYYTLWWFSAAAVLLCFVSIALYQWTNSKNITLTTAANEKRQYSLPDGSVIILNENTTVRYNLNKFERDRGLSLLEGEAFFEVVHDPSKVFHIDMGDLRVTDIGTSFMVQRSGPEISVIVSSGRVAFEQLSSGNHVILDPGKKGIFLKGAKSIIEAPNPHLNYKSWIDKKLYFRNTPLLEVTKELKRTYGVNVTLRDNRLRKRTLSASLKYATADSALLVISESLQLKVHKANTGYILDSK